ncbi:MFS transporter [Oerskovia sp. M15]
MEFSVTTLSSAHPGTPRAPDLVGRLAIALTAVNLRTAVTGFTLLEIIGSDLGFGVALAGLLGTVPAASFAIFGFLAPVVTRRFGLERTATAALGLTALSLVVRAFSPTPFVLVLSTALALAGIGAANVVIVPLVKAWFADRLALWTSLYLILLQTGQFVAPLLAVPVAEATSWRLSIGIWRARLRWLRWSGSSWQPSCPVTTDPRPRRWPVRDRGSADRRPPGAWWSCSR